MRLQKPMVAISAVGLLALAACGGATGGTGTGAGPSGGGVDTSAFPTTATPPGSGQDPTAQGPATPIPGAKTGGTLTVLKADTITTLDPSEAYYTDSTSILSGLVVRSLTQYKWDPQTKEMVLVPDLATDLGQHNADYTKWTFTLRSGIKFDNGQAVTPADIKFAILRSFDRATFPSGASYSNDYFKGGDTYQGPYTSKGKDCGCVSIDGMKITIAMSQPFPDMPYWAAFPAMSPIPPGNASDPAQYKLHPWATGPYMFKPGSYTVGKKLTLIRNPEWDPKTDPARHDYINEYDFNFNADSSQTDQLLLQNTGSGQTTMTYNNVLAADYGSFVSEASDRLVKGPNPCTFMIYPDNRKITDIDVRRAMGLAYPYQDAWSAAGSIQNVTRIPASNIMPPGIPGRTPYNPRGSAYTPGDTYPEAAKALLKKSGHLGYQLEFPYLTDDPNSVALKNVLVQAYQAAGFTTKPYATTGANYATQVLQNPDWPGNLRSVGWCSDWPSGGSWFPPVFHSTDIAKSGFGSNFAAFDKADARIESIQAMPLDKQPVAWNALDKWIQTKYYPIVVTGYGADAMIRGSKVMNMTNDPVYGMPNWKDMWLAS